jgi:multicomponent Na+:H+ antiporter subunit F
MKLLKYFLGLISLILVVSVILFIYPIYPFKEGAALAWEPFFKRGLGILFLSGFFCLYRILRGPTASDRIVAIDMLGILIIGVCCLLPIVTGRSWYIDIGIAWALQSFISTLALAKFLEGKDFDE